MGMGLHQFLKPLHNKRNDEKSEKATYTIRVIICKAYS